MGNKRRVPLNLMGKDAIDYGRIPVTFGVPFSEGELESKDNIRLVNNKSEEFPVQTGILTTWSEELDYIKWLLIDSQIEADRKSEYFLEYGGDVSSRTPEQKIKVHEEDDHYFINNGVLKLKIRHTFKPWTQPSNPDYFAGCKVKTDDGWQEMFPNNPGPFLYMTDQDENKYDSFSGGLESVVIEEKGPLRVSIRVKGYHLGQEGTRFCPYILRLHVFAGFKFIKFQHTFIFDQDPHNVELNSIGMKFPLNLGHDLRAAFGGSNQPHFVTHWDRFEFLQKGEADYEVYRNEQIFDSGDKTSGWGSLNGKRGSALAVIKNSWQEYPKGISLDDTGIDLQIWPDSYRDNLTFTTPFEEPAVNLGEAIDHSIVDSRKREHTGIRSEKEFKQKLEENPTAPLNLASLNPQNMDDMEWIDQMVNKYAPDRAKSFSRDIGQENGVGAAKTTELFLYVDHREIHDKKAESRARAIQEPLIVSANAEYICNSGVFGHMYPAGDPRFSLIDKDLDTIHELGSECGYTGMMEYGNSNTGHVMDSMVYAYYKDKDPEKVREYCAFNNEARDEMMSAWCKFVRTGNRKDYLRAKAYTGNVADVAYIHINPFNPGSEGKIHYHGPHPWCGGASVSHTHITGLLTHYYFTGNRRMLEIAREVADGIVEAQEPAGIIPSSGGLLRNFGAPLSVLLEMYQATWEQKYGELARKSLNWLLRTLYEPGQFPQAVITAGERGDKAVVYAPGLDEGNWGNSYYWYRAAARLFPSKTLEDHLIALADYYTWKLPLDMNIGTYDESTVVCFAYDMTHNFSYAAFAKYIIENKFRKHVEETTDGFGITYFNGFIPRLLQIVADARDRDEKALAEAYKEWQEKRKEIPPRKSRKRPSGKVTKDLGRLSTESHPAAEKLS